MRGDWVEDVHGFWFGELKPAAWFRTDPAVDEAIRTRFGVLWAALRDRPQGPADGRAAVAGVIVLDQFPRNMFRGSAEAYATDPQALALSGAALAAGLDSGLSDPERMFLYMPFHHSEDQADQDRAVELLSGLSVEGALASAEGHRAIVARFGRFPHRNAVLGRVSTPEEVEHLKTARGFERL